MSSHSCGGRGPAFSTQQKGIRIERVDLAAKAEPLPAGPFDAAPSLRGRDPGHGTGRSRVDADQRRRLTPSVRARVNSGAGTIVFCSSMAVYGRIAADVVDPDTPINEPNAYGWSKLTCRASARRTQPCASWPARLVDPTAGRRGPGIARQLSVGHDGLPRRRRDRYRSQSRCAVQQRRPYRRSCAFRRHAARRRCRPGIR